MVVETAFDLIVGLSPTPVEGVVGPALIRPPSSVGDYELTAHVVADGFDVAPGETWRKTMLVSAAAPYPYVVFHLVAPAEPDPDHPRAINVLYSVDSQTMGLGVRSVRVVATPADVDAVAPLPLPSAGSLGFRSLISRPISPCASCTAASRAGCCGRSNRRTPRSTPTPRHRSATLPMHLPEP